MGRKKSSPWLLVVAICSTTGVVLGGTTSWAESNRCLQAPEPSSTCLTQDPQIKLLEGMGTGLIAGMSAAVGVTWRW